MPGIIGGSGNLCVFFILMTLCVRFLRGNNELFIAIIGYYVARNVWIALFASIFSNKGMFEIICIINPISTQ